MSSNKPKAIFVWSGGKDTSVLIQEFIDKGFKTITCCINDAHLDESWVGKEIDEDFL